jgi:hypothetical protein
MTRGTPGLILLIFAALLMAAALVRLIEARTEPEPDVVQPLTGLGDSHYYTSLSDNDFYNAALVFDATRKGLFRRTVHPVHRVDARMVRHEVESTGQFVVYTELRLGNGTKAKGPTRWFLKAGPDHYVEFGERKYYPAYKKPT